MSLHALVVEFDAAADRYAERRDLPEGMPDNVAHAMGSVYRACAKRLLAALAGGGDAVACRVEWQSSLIRSAERAECAEAHFSGLEAEVEQWKRNTLTFKERGDRLAFDVHSLERKLEAAEARFAELEAKYEDAVTKYAAAVEKYLSALDSRDEWREKAKTAEARALEAEEMLAWFANNPYAYRIMADKCSEAAAFLAANGERHE